MTAILAFRLKVPGTDQFQGLHAVSTSYRFQGFLRLSGSALIIEWSGVAQVQDVGALTIRDDKLSLPDERLTVPVSHLYRATLAGGWFRPRLVLQARELGSLALVPSEEHGVVQFWYARADRQLATAMVAALTDAIGAASQSALLSVTERVIHESASTPPGGVTGG